MSDWRQIQARIRKARTSADPPGQLAALYERTRDAMVAFELAQIHEKSGAHSEAARWYTSAAERFRRAQWKLKAEEALIRLGAPIPTTAAAAPEHESGAEPDAQLEHVTLEPSEEHSVTIAIESGVSLETPSPAPSAELPAAAPSLEIVPPHRRKRRGRRGGRGRNKNTRTDVAALPALVPVAAPQTSERSAEAMPLPVVLPYVSEAIVAPRTAQPEVAGIFEATSNDASLKLRTRPGDPALSSRMTQLESQLRRLLACSVHPVDLPDEAPAGPGVFLITDTDQTCYYYIESCQTLRVGIGNLLRSGRGSREGANLKEKMAEHLGINDARVGKYLKDHCIVRWLQLDEGAPLLAHFAVAVLRPIAND